MDNFVVSARKYRPQQFNTVVGQSHITTTLKNAILNNQLAHAFLFCGPRGVGKTTCARILAKTINCESRDQEGEACNQCNSCKSFDQGTSFNLNELDAASNNGVDDMRDLTEQVRFAPQSGKYKVYIVDEVHMLSTSAFNAFLKTLEEPPPHAIFILATTEKHKILPTILSRCQIFDFKRITPNDTVEHLEEIIGKEGIQAERTALHLIAQKSEGCMRDALSIMDKIVSFTGGHLTYSNTLEHLNILDEDYYFRWIDQMQQQKLADALVLFDEIHQKGFEGDTILEGFSEFIRNILVCKDDKTISLLEVAEDFKPNYKKFADQVNTGWLIAALNILNESAIQLKQVRNKKLHIELLLIKLSYLSQAIELTAQPGSLEKKKTTELTKSVSFRGIDFRIASASKKPQEKQATDTSKASLLVEKSEKAVSKKPATESMKLPSVQDVQNPIKQAINKPHLGSLNSIRNQVLENTMKGQQHRPLNDADLQIAMNEFIEILKTNGHHSSASHFRNASMEVLDEHQFSIKSESKIQQKFIENERADLIEHLQRYFFNKKLKYHLILEEQETEDQVNLPQINHKEHFLQLTARYPLLKELKERLQMNLDF
jgi:DNA polymerase-3 subunit gamma/tau